MYSEIVDTISNVGFPIAMVLLIYFDLRKKIDKLNDNLRVIIARVV